MSFLGDPDLPSVPSMTQEAQDFVEALLTDSRTQAASAVQDARDAIEDLKNATPPEDIPEPPLPPTVTTSIDSAIGGNFSENPDIGEIIVNDPLVFALEDIEIPDLEDDIPEYVALISGVSIPGDVTPLSLELPTPPTIETTLDIPDAPVADYGDIPDLLTLDLPTYVAPSLEAFDVDVPEFDALVPSSAVDWAEPEYEAWIADQLKTVLQTMLAGGTGIDPAVEQQIWDRERARLDVVARKAIEDARDDFAASGFDLPGITVLARAMAARTANQIEVSKSSRDVAIKQADLEQTNRQFAIKTGAELENIFVQIFLQTADRSFQIAKYAVEARIQIFNAEVAAFNVEQQIFSARVERYKVGLAYVQAQIESYKARLEAERIKTEINRDLIEAFKAKIAAFQAQADAYRALVQAASARADLQKVRMEVYRAQIEGAQATVAAKKSEYDAYASRIQGEVAKVGLEESNSRSYAARVGAISSVSEIKVKGADLKMTKQKLRLEAHLGELKRLGDLASLQLNAIQARAATYDATTRRDVARYDMDKSAKELAIQTTIENTRTLISRYASQIEVWKARVQQLIEYSRITGESIRAAGQIAGTLAAGAYAGTSVSAAFGGSVSRGETTSHGRSYSESKTEANNTTSETRHNYEHDV